MANPNIILDGYGPGGGNVPTDGYGALETFVQTPVFAPVKIGKGLYTWIVDQIQLEEASTGQTVATAYTNPSNDVNNDHGIQVDSLSHDAIENLVILMAYLSGITYNVPDFPSPGHLQPDRMNDANLSKLIRRLRRSMVISANSEFVKARFAGGDFFAPLEDTGNIRDPDPDSG